MFVCLCTLRSLVFYYLHSPLIDSKNCRFEPLIEKREEKREERRERREREKREQKRERGEEKLHSKSVKLFVRVN